MLLGDRHRWLYWQPKRPATWAGRAGRLSSDPPFCCLAPVRAAAVFHRPVQQAGPAIALAAAAGSAGPGRHCAAWLIPTEAQALAGPQATAPTPPDAAEPLSLVKLARLLPAVLAASGRPGRSGSRPSTRACCGSMPPICSIPGCRRGRLRKVAEAEVPLDGAADTRIVAFRTEDGSSEHLAIVVGTPDATRGAAGPAAFRMLHWRSARQPALRLRRAVQGAIRRMGEEGAGIVLYLAQEGRSIGLVNKLRAYALQDRGMDTLDANRALGWGADERNFLVAATMLQELGIEAYPCC